MRSSLFGDGHELSGAVGGRPERVAFRTRQPLETAGLGHLHDGRVGVVEETDLGFDRSTKGIQGLDRYPPSIAGIDQDVQGAFAAVGNWTGEA